MKIIRDLKTGFRRMWLLQNIWGSPKIGKGTRIGAFVDIGRDVEIGENCKIQSFVSIPPGWKIGNNVFIGPGARFANDKRPNLKHHFDPQIGIVEDYAVIGIGAIILPCRIGRGAVVGAGAVVLKDIEADSKVVGNPAKPI